MSTEPDYETILVRAIQQHRRTLMSTQDPEVRRVADIELWHSIGQLATLKRHILETSHGAPNVGREHPRAQ